MLSREEAEEHEDIQRVHKYFQEIALEDPDAPDISMAEYLDRRGANDTIIQLAECKCIILLSHCWKFVGGVVCVLNREDS